jgi:predicted anti-sigma-YlaC factor YlaD
MICIDEQLLQKYIDGECQEKERTVVKLHLLDCPACTQKYEERQKLSEGIKGAINTLNIERIEIPIFKNKDTISPRKNIKLIIYSLSAACILLFVLFLVDKKIDSHQREITIVQSIPMQVDANRPASDQEFVIEVYDGKGQRSEYFVE